MRSARRSRDCARARAWCARVAVRAPSATAYDGPAATRRRPHHPHRELAPPSPNTTIARHVGADRARAGRPAATRPGRRARRAGEQVIHMHHELVVRELVARLARPRLLVVPLAILLGQAPATDPTSCSAAACASSCAGAAPRPVLARRDGSGRRYQTPAALAGAARLAPPALARRARTLARRTSACAGAAARRRHIGCRRRLRRCRSSTGCDAGRGDVQRHQAVARQVAARGRLLRDDLPDQLRARSRTSDQGRGAARHAAPPGRPRRLAAPRTRRPPGVPRGRPGGWLCALRSPRCWQLRFCRSSRLLTRTRGQRPTNCLDSRPSRAVLLPELSTRAAERVADD